MQKKYSPAKNIRDFKEKENNNRRELVKKQKPQSVGSQSLLEETSTATKTADKTPKKNAFEFMMNARNRSIGANSPGKEPISSSDPSNASTDINKVKRRLMLEEWANRKGGAKRKAKEIENEEYIDHQMKRRAKRLKKLISNGCSKSTNKSSPVDKTSSPESCPTTKIKSISTAPSPTQTNQNKESKIELANNSNSNKSNDISLDLTTETAVGSEMNDTSNLNGSFFKFHFKKIDKIIGDQPKRSKKRVRVFDSDEDVDVEAIEAAAIPVSTANIVSQSIPILHTPLAVTECRKSDVAVGKKSSKIQQKSPKEPFMQVLSSPIKKRDSLLGYFNKIAKFTTSGSSTVDESDDVLSVDCSDKEPAAMPENLKKRRGRPQACTSLNNVRDQTLPTTPVVNTTTSGRPKRACRDRVLIHKDELEKSPAKVAAQKSLKRARRLLSSGSISPHKSPSKLSKTPKRKLASVFIKAPTKPFIDPAVTLARQKFLLSGIPDCMKADIERQRTYVEIFECEAEIFPTVSHVRQWDETSYISVVENYNLNFRADYNENDSLETTQSFKYGRPIVLTSLEKEHGVENVKERLRSTEITDPNKLVRSLKTADTLKFLYIKCYKRLRERCEAENNTKITIIDSSTDDDSIVIVDDLPPVVRFSGSLVYTEKYRAATSEDILVNSAPVEELKKFLATWQEDNCGNRRFNSDEDDDDFDNGTNSASGLGQSVLNKAVVLLGPNGSGKTSAVYALANELNFKVLEINAGGKRTGKKILQELQEATQSHQVKGGTGKSSENRKLFKNSSSEESSSGYGASQHSQKLSLILIEDADIVFEQDFGFIDAIYQLATTSKRPIILVANLKNCDHLARFISHNCIVFKNPPIQHISRWLSLLTITEKQYVGREQCAKLYERNGCDLRRTLLELQFYVQTGGDEKPKLSNGQHEHVGLYDFYTVNQNDEEVVQFPVNIDAVHEKCSEILKPDNSNMDDTLLFYQNMSSALLIQSRHRWNDHIVNSLSEEISHDLVQRTIQQRSKSARKPVHIHPAIRSTSRSLRYFKFTTLKQY